MSDNHISNYQKKLLEKFESFLIPSKKDFHQIKNYLANKFTFKEVALEKRVYAKYYYTELCNAFFSHRNIYYHNRFKSNDYKLDLQIYLVEDDFKSVNYYKHQNLFQSEYEPILVFFENTIEYFSTTSSKLSLELSIFHGISQEDIDNKTVRLFEYLSSFENSHEKAFGTLI
ncbi:MAG: hypothetical protein FWF50_06490 [Defluviitaleaceae bacterium]|nr:hypothetical protein [Defluviitaleaceae bacterium]